MYNNKGSECRGGRWGLRFCGFGLFLTRFCGFREKLMRFCGFSLFCGLRFLPVFATFLRFYQQLCRFCGFARFSSAVFKDFLMRFCGFGYPPKTPPSRGSFKYYVTLSCLYRRFYYGNFCLISYFQLSFQALFY